MVLLVGCSSVLGIEDPRPAGDGGMAQDGQDGQPISQCHPVINELMTGSSVSPADEWVEVYNGCPAPVDVTSWTLVYRSASNDGSNDSSTLATLTGSMATGEFRLYAGSGFTGTYDYQWTGMNGLIGQFDGAVGLRDNNRALVDSMAYGAVVATHPFIETKPTPAMANGKSASRLPLDGNDTNDNSVDFQIIAAGTPRASNVL